MCTAMCFQVVYPFPPAFKVLAFSAWLFAPNKHYLGVLKLATLRFAVPRGPILLF